VSAAPASHVYFSQRLRLHYIDWGNEDSPALVFVHGIHDHCRTWDHLAAEFVDDHHVVVPDLRGHGDSEWVRGSSYHYMDYIYDLHQLIHQAQLAPVTLVGHSMGGAIAALFAGIFPEMVQKLVIIEGIGLWREMLPPVAVHDRVREWVESTRALSGRLPRRYADLSEAYQRMQQANPQLTANQALHLTVHGSNQNEDGTFSWKYDNYTYNFSASGFATEDVISLWRRIAAPVLIINASQGMEHRIGQDGTLEHFSDATLHVVQGAGHWTYHDNHTEVLSQVQKFLAQ
jgi:pimeloyl-ACP methyl ester carboxylesterase